ncbi:sigma factor [Salinarimonas soli]|uniref:Uncharacterized protein n=1 Tax=Salinarimonas soli TaxID=1638099 RepID=A0A5B2VF63_9HYPH|nr:sigma factor [Salinarimonas soli]KAA2237080.1 hypothetical protein F0L46_11495 [Salinarimonas soli]
MPISPADASVLQNEADRAARQVCRRLRLAPHDREDVRQDLLADVLARLRFYDARRGSLGAFAGTVMKRRAARLAHRIQRDRARLAPMSLDAPVPGGDGLTFADTISESDGHAATVGQPFDSFAMVDRRLDCECALGLLDGADLALCQQLVDQTPTEIARAGVTARAKIYRQLASIRLTLTAIGFAA